MNSPLTELSMENNEVKPHDLAVPLSSKTHKTTMQFNSAETYTTYNEQSDPQ